MSFYPPHKNFGHLPPDIASPPPLGVTLSQYQILFGCLKYSLLQRCLEYKPFHLHGVFHLAVFHQDVAHFSQYPGLLHQECI